MSPALAQFNSKGLIIGKAGAQFAPAGTPCRDLEMFACSDGSASGLMARGCRLGDVVLYLGQCYRIGKSCACATLVDATVVSGCGDPACSGGGGILPPASCLAADLFGPCATSYAVKITAWNDYLGSGQPRMVGNHTVTWASPIPASPDGAVSGYAQGWYGYELVDTSICAARAGMAAAYMCFIILCWGFPSPTNNWYMYLVDGCESNGDAAWGTGPTPALSTWVSISGDSSPLRVSVA